METPLSDVVKIDQGIATTGAGTTTINGTEIDMESYEGVLFVIKFGTAASNNSIKAQQDVVTGMAGAADLLGTLVAVGASDEIVALDLVKPRKRFVRMAAVRGTSTTIDWGIAIRYGSRKRPVTSALAGTLAIEQHVSPAEGTA
jgi:hypothetical protein